MKKHQSNCTAPICLEDDNKDTVWWAGEEVCNKRPTTELQRRQKRINKEFVEGGAMDRCWTRRQLDESSL